MVSAGQAAAIGVGVTGAIIGTVLLANELSKRRSHAYYRPMFWYPRRPRWQHHHHHD